MSKKRTRLSRKESQELTRQRLLDAAVVVFAEKGFALARLDEVAEQAGYSKGAVYSNFSSKEELALAVLDKQRDQQLEMIAEQVLAHGHETRFWAQQAQGSSQNLLSIELWVQAQHNEALREKMAERRRQTNYALAKILSSEAEPLAKHRNFVNLIGALSAGLAIHYTLTPDQELIEQWSAIATKLFNEMRAD